VREAIPRSILLFERLFLASLAAGVMQAWIGWEALEARAASLGHGAGAMLLMLALVFGTLAGVVLLVSRGRQRSAKWVLVILAVIGLPIFLVGLEQGTVVGSTFLALAQAALQVGSLFYLFTREAKAWLAGGEP
jgi:predicted membrane channel-forming protein YqfA (hemolysin III family)